jgi:hypothetical protein
MAPLVEQAMLSLLCSGLSIAATWVVNKGKTLVPSTAATPNGATVGKASHAQLVVQRAQHRCHLVVNTVK